MYIDFTGHFASIKAMAEKYKATFISIQNYYTFVNFDDAERAQAFYEWTVKDHLKTNGINTKRPYVPFEIAIHHPE